ncbi:MAG: hypothetical protein AAFY71_00920 [Bacteroidota bacterium]
MKITQLPTLLLLLLVPPLLWGQSETSILTDAIKLYDVYYDAPNAKVSPSKGDLSQFLEIMQDNYGGTDPIGVAALIQHYKENNPFLGSDFIEWSEANQTINLRKANEKALILPGLPNVPALPLTTFALDLSDFLVQRTKDELNIAFFYRLYNFLDREENAPARMLFPQTYQDLKLLSDQIFDLQSYMEGLQVSFQRDLAFLPEHLVGTLQTLDIKDETLNAQLDLLNAFLIAGDGVVRKKFAPVEVINSLANFPFPQKTLDQIGEFVGAVQFLNTLVFEGFWDPIEGIFLDFESQISRIEDENLRRIFLGLVYERVQAFEIQKGQTLGSLIKNKKAEFLGIQDQLLQIGSRIHQIEVDFLLWEDLSEFDRNDPATYLSFTQRSTANFNDLFTATETILKDLGLASVSLEKIESWNNILADFGELVADVNTENYSHAIMTMVRWLDPVLEDKLTSRILFFGSFIAAVVESDTPEQLANLIETYALPPGSSSKKKNSEWSLSLNSYVGVYYGLEKLETDTQRAGVYGVNAPIGFALNKGFGRAGSVSLFASVLDLGGIVAYRFNDETTANFPQLTLENLFAPGVYGIYGFGENIPLSVGAGYQWGPQIREVNVTLGGITTVTPVQSLGRINVFIGVDLHLLHLWNRPFAGQRP